MIKIIQTLKCLCGSSKFDLFVCDPDSFAIPQHALELDQVKSTGSLYHNTYFAIDLLPYFIGNSGKLLTLPERRRFWLTFESNEAMIEFKLTYL